MTQKLDSQSKNTVLKDSPSCSCTKVNFSRGSLSTFENFYPEWLPFCPQLIDLEPWLGWLFDSIHTHHTPHTPNTKQDTAHTTYTTHYQHTHNTTTIPHTTHNTQHTYTIPHTPHTHTHPTHTTHTPPPPPLPPPPHHHHQTLRLCNRKSSTTFPKGTPHSWASTTRAVASRPTRHPRLNYTG